MAEENVLRGRELAQAPLDQSKKRTIRNLPGHNEKAVRTLFEEIVVQGFGYSNKQFREKYTSAMPAHDEVISTASIRSILKGIRSIYIERGIDDNKLDALSDVIVDFSRVRLPTNMSGRAGRGLSTSQHPTRENGGFFISGRRTGAHNVLDLERRSFVNDTMKTALQSKKSIYEVSNEVVSRSIEYHLYNFTAPITAANVRPHAVRGIPLSDQWRQLQARDGLKLISKDAGGRIGESGGSVDGEIAHQPHTANWRVGRGPAPRWSSPLRRVMAAAPQSRMRGNSGGARLS